MASIRKRGNKFQAQVRRAGFQGKSKSFERLTEAKAWARSQEIYFDRGEAGNQKPDDMPLASTQLVHTLPRMDTPLALKR